jgi:hypothetical protein
MSCRIAGDIQTGLLLWLLLGGKARPAEAGAVTADFFREGKFSHVLAIEFGRALRPRSAPEPRAEQQAQSYPSQRSVIPAQVSFCILQGKSPVGIGGGA